MKAATRARRGKSAKSVRRIIESRDVPIPPDWQGFLSHSANKAALSHFLSTELVRCSPPDKTIVVAVGFVDESEVACNKPAVDTKQLVGHHEEADTRIVLHCMHAETDTIVV